ncbi:hypothetical protein BGZ96_003815 [Linnemannia gamsii]|uniref:Uncharacterized protein n=1 Tax=Linnemannia gamsii TaxID=64522 RepID=A0ABQ7K7D8_9FUNG|nr:hypothetical protein BGZ96_003815 [Linnemannia gamsii]
MALYITTSSRLTPEEEQELRSNPGSTDQLHVPSSSDDLTKTAKLGSTTTTSSPLTDVSPSISVLNSSSVTAAAATESAKPKMLVPITIANKNQNQQQKQKSGKQEQGSPGRRRSIDVGSKATLLEEVRSQIQASASMDDDMDDLVAKSSRITPTILVSASSPSPTVLIRPRTTTNNINGEKSTAVVTVLVPSKPTVQKNPRELVHDIQSSSSTSRASVHSTSPTVISSTSSTSGGVLQQRRNTSLGSHTSLTTTLVTGAATSTTRAAAAV